MPYDKDFARLCAWLKVRGLTAHTDRNGKTVFRVKAKRRAPWNEIAKPSL